MSDQQKQSLCPRLIDYLAIVGAKNTPVQRGGSGTNNQSPVQVCLYFYFTNLLLASFLLQLTHLDYFVHLETFHVQTQKYITFDDVHY